MCRLPKDFFDLLKHFDSFSHCVEIALIIDINLVNRLMMFCNFTGAELGGDIIKAWLDRKQRDVSKKQWDIVNAAISKCNLPLYVKLVSDVH